jgi:hypothetical protein
MGLGVACAVAHHSPLPATYDGRTLRPTAPRGSEGQCPHRADAHDHHEGGHGKATERGWASNAHEAGVPSGGSLGRNLRSKTRWFTGFCNSHHVSHFATFFIDARAEISNDPSAGSPTETLLRLLLPLSDMVYLNFPARWSLHDLPEHSPKGSPDHSKSVGATGGVYKGQGRNQHKLMTCAY